MASTPSSEVPIEVREAMLSLEGEKLDLERARFEFERARKSSDPKHRTIVLGVIGSVLTGIFSVAAVLITQTITTKNVELTNIAKEKEVELTNIAKERELALARDLHNQAWRLAFEKFVTENRSVLFSEDSAEKDSLSRLMLVVYPGEILADYKRNMELTDRFAQPSDPGLERKRKVLTELLGPLVTQLARTKEAFDRWVSKNLYLETKIIKKGNEAARNLLVSKSDLIPPDLVPDAILLVKHYDVWLEEYQRVRGGKEPDLDQPFVFAGPRGFPFPVTSERRFTERYEQYKADLARDG